MQPPTPWEIATPSPSWRLPGVAMAGFRARGTADLGVVPFPAVTLAIDLGPEPLLVADGGRQVRGSAVIGLAPGGLWGGGREVQCLQVRLSPVVAHTVLEGFAAEGSPLAGWDEVWGRDAARLEEQLRASASWEERFALMAGALAARRPEGRPVDKEVAYAWSELARSHGTARVDALAAEVGWSRKRLWSRFRSQVGLPPKQAARLVRFDHAAHRLAAGGHPAAVAAEAGYADQSHLHREVADFARLTPSAVAREPWLSVDGVAWSSPGYLRG
ncbi:helix-turn-helix domain-containing protein [Kitasatospora phosalacinea]|uniref:AraC family transcriptional regulator n=1 Tax=Kitasatospora phosalacinea TaxID=2065 RepID=A0A9W6PEH2_9ACTN|nr:helix-turn-helix domain-containing protein [Kitasatospora phosalacinea]GLW53509.1 AraC family transcriptional regulator [Kitasatospora phosalacinea]